MRASCVRSYAFICLSLNNTASGPLLSRQISSRKFATKDFGVAPKRKGEVPLMLQRQRGNKRHCQLRVLLACSAAELRCHYQTYIISYRTIPYLSLLHSGAYLVPPGRRHAQPSQAPTSSQSCTNSKSVQTQRGRGVERHRDDGQRLFPERPLLTLPLSWLAPNSMPTPCRSRLMIIIVRRAWRRLVWLLDCGRGLGHYQI